MPRSGGFLTTLGYLAPWMGKILKPTLEKKGARVKAKLKDEQKRRESDSPDH